MVMLPHKRLVSILLAACLAVAAVFAEGFVLANLDHDHGGGPCPVCLQLEAARILFEGLGRAGLFSPALCFVPGISVAKNRLCFSLALQTLVGLKIKHTS
jgi:hypothetical protein